MALYWGIEISSINDLLGALRSSSLTARFTLYGGIQAPLPANQWQREVENWNDILLATSQGAAVDEAVGPGSSEMLDLFWTKPDNDVARYRCKNQV